MWKVNAVNILVTVKIGGNVNNRKGVQKNAFLKALRTACLSADAFFVSGFLSDFLEGEKGEKRVNY